MNLVPAILLAIVLGVAVCTDLKSRRIPNWLTLPAIVLGMGWAGMATGWDGVLSSLQGSGVALAVMLIPFVLGWTGGGDVKLVIAIGALKGPSFVFLVCLYAALVGGVIAAAVLLRQRKLRAALLYLFLFWRVPANSRTSLATGTIPYAPAIALGALAVLASLEIMPSTLGWTLL